MTHFIPIPEFTVTQSRNFWAKIRPTGFCWEWTAARTQDGYGKFNLGKGKQVIAHRATYTMLVGAIPEGLELDHLCRNRQCTNPDHLEPVTNAENQRRVPFRRFANGGMPSWVVSGKDITGKCIRDHVYTPENTYTYKDGRTECRICKKAVAAAYRARSRQVCTNPV